MSTDVMVCNFKKALYIPSCIMYLIYTTNKYKNVRVLFHVVTNPQRSRVSRKPSFEVSDQVRNNPGSTTSADISK